MEYNERLKKLGLPTLVYRRARGDMIEVFKILSGKYDPLVADFLPLHRDVRGTRTRGHSLKLLRRDFKHDIAKYAFSRRVVAAWNNLTDEVVSAPTLHTFENRLDRRWNRLDVRYNLEASIKNLAPYAEVTGGTIGLGTLAEQR